MRKARAGAVHHGVLVAGGVAVLCLALAVCSDGGGPDGHGDAADAMDGDDGGRRRGCYRRHRDVGLG